MKRVNFFSLAAAALAVACVSQAHADGSISLTQVWTHESGIFGESAAEIGAFDSKSQRVFVTSAATDKVDVLDILTGEKVAELPTPISRPCTSVNCPMPADDPAMT